MRASANKKLVGLRRYHATRPVRTRLKLLEALDRMESGHTVVVGREFKWSKTTLALEAGVNVNTVVRKLPGGQWVFPEINERFDQLKGKRSRSCPSAMLSENGPRRVHAKPTNPLRRLSPDHPGPRHRQLRLH